MILPQHLESLFPTRRHCWQLAAGELCAARCLDELSRRLPGIEPASWPQRFALGGVYVAGKRASPETVLSPPCRLEYYEPLCRLEEFASLYPAFDPGWILHRDPDLVVAYKPAALPSTPPRDQVVYNLQSYLHSFLGAPAHLPSRLDIGVSGVLLCSLSTRMNRYLQRAYDHRRVHRLYLAEVYGSPAWNERDVHVPLTRHPLYPVLRTLISDSDEPAGAAPQESAHTRLTVLARYPDPGDGSPRALLLAQPFTGRTHQIRLHCSAQGLPIVDDPLYGVRGDGEPLVRSPRTRTPAATVAAWPGLRLVAYEVRLHHPYLNAPLHVALPSHLRPAWVRDHPVLEGG
jgi:tRNA pseudouridine32 synthase/23S rRNA pseudouridine746 synthase